MADPAESIQPSRVARAATLLIAAHVVFILLFIAGAALSIWAFADNGQSSVNCFGLATSCGHHHSYVPGAVLLVVGFVGNLVTMAVGARVAVAVGMSAFSYYQRRRMSMSSMDATTPPMGMPPTSTDPPGWVGGQPPGTPGSPTGPLI